MATGATQHRRRAPMRSATSSQSRSGALLPVSSCPAGAWGSDEAVEEHLPDVWPLGTGCRSCIDNAPCMLCRMPSEPSALLCALQRAEQALHSGRPHWLMGHTKRAASPCWAGCAPRRLGREGRCWPRPHANFGSVAQEFKKFLFLLFELVRIVLNFRNSYLSTHSSKNDEISFVGFVIL
jgi:hypothetical protein